jgi:hypothetical protein
LSPINDIVLTPGRHRSPSAHYPLRVSGLYGRLETSTVTPETFYAR